MNAAILSLALSALLAPPVETAPKPSTRVYVRTDPTGAEVKLDGKPMGKSDDLFVVPPGVSKMIIEVDLDGHYPKKQEVVVRGGQITRVELKMERLSGGEAKTPAPHSAKDTTATVKESIEAISTLAEGDPKLDKVLQSLKGLDQAGVVDEVAKFLDSKENTIRRAAIYILWRGEFKSIEPAVPQLLHLCEHKEELTRGMAAIALGANHVEKSLPVSMKMTSEDSSGYARRAAAYALGLLGNKEAVPTLKKALEDSDPLVRDNAAVALRIIEREQKFGEKASPAVPRDAATAAPDAVERRIAEELKKPTQVQFVETPLQDVIEFLKQYHGIEIQLDKKALDEVAIGFDASITKNLKGISLGSALRLILRDLDLVYVIHDEVLLITTKAGAAAITASEEKSVVVSRREVNRLVSNFADRPDLSTPESACAAFQRASAQKDAQATSQLSWVRLDPSLQAAWYRKEEARDPAGMAIYLKALAESKIMEVQTLRGELANVVTYLPFPPGKGRDPYTARCFGLINGEWKNLGEDRVPTLEAARADFERKKERLWQQFVEIKNNRQRSEPLVKSELKTSPVRIDSAVVKGRRAVIQGESGKGSTMYFFVGDTGVTSNLPADDLFTVTISDRHGISCDVAESGGRIRYPALPSNLSVEFDEGKIVFLQGPVKPRSDGAYVVAEFHPNKGGEAVPIGVRFGQAGQSQGKPPALTIPSAVPPASSYAPPATAATKGPAASRAWKSTMFDATFTPLTKDGLSLDQGAWRIEAKQNRTVRLYETHLGGFDAPGVDDCQLTYRAMLKSDGLEGRAYLEMWVRLPTGEFFSKGLDAPVTGTTDWASYQTPFFLKKGERADLVKLNLVIEGKGTVWIKDVELVKGPLPQESPPSAAVPAKNALVFDGTSGYATVPPTNFTGGDFTISVWFNPTGNRGQFQFLMMRGRSFHDQPGDIGLKMNPDGNLDFQLRTSTNEWLFGWDVPESVLHCDAKDIHWNQWNHVVVTKRTSHYKMWMNGSQVADAFSTANVSDTDDTNPFLLGAFENSDGNGIDDPLAGKLDEVVIFNRALESGEVSALYNRGRGLYAALSRPPFDNDLVLGWHFDETGGNSAADFSGHGKTATLSATGATWGLGEGIVEGPAPPGSPVSAFGSKLLESLKAKDVAEPREALPYKVEVLNYEIESPSSPEEKPVDTGQLIRAVVRRISPPSGPKVPVMVQSKWIAGKMQIEILVPHSFADRVGPRLASPGTLEFHILADRKDHKTLIEKAEAETAKAKKEHRAIPNEVQEENGKLIGWWVPLDEGERAADVQRVEGLLSHPETVKRTIDQDGREVRQILVAADEFNVSGRYFTLVEAARSNGGATCVNFALNAEGAKRLLGLTRGNLPDAVNNHLRRLGIILDGRLYSAPHVMSPISDRGVIEGSFTQQEVEDLAASLSTGPLPAKLKLIDRHTQSTKTPWPGTTGTQTQKDPGETP